MTSSESRDETIESAEWQRKEVNSLYAAVYSMPDPSANDELHRSLVEAEAKLVALDQGSKPPSEADASRAVRAAAHGRFLGPKTTGLRVETILRMKPLPTGVYHLMDPETDPLLTVKVANESLDTRRIRVMAFLEGLSAQSVRTVELDPRQEITLKLLPTLLPERAHAITEIQRATLHVLVEDLDGKPESHDTFNVVCLARTSSFNSVHDPVSGEYTDLSHYYGAWVTPYAEVVQERIRRAAELLPRQQIWGYQREPDSVRAQVGAFFQSLKEAGIVYINSVIDYGASAGQATQRTRLPRESIALRSANCIDGTVLMASLLEGASLNPAIVLVPGHAFIGWETWYQSDEWRFMETTMIGTADFDAACKSGQHQYDQYRTLAPQRLKMHRLSDLRRRGIWPME